MRTFAVPRIRSLKHTGKHFPPAEFRVEDYLKASLGVWRGSAQPVALVFEKRIAPWVEEKRWLYVLGLSLFLATCGSAHPARREQGEHLRGEAPLRPFPRCGPVPRLEPSGRPLARPGPAPQSLLEQPQ
ncbi:MAG: hypothetical protein HY652_10085 [Acidobacteria bacterium]|nr:hypothetical protein [Acidobacteriota bacterium]